jgi:RNA polymerase sigma-70 factor, ECF subfamily
MCPVLNRAKLTAAETSVSCPYTVRKARRGCTARHNRNLGNPDSLLERDAIRLSSFRAGEAASGEAPERCARKLPDAKLETTGAGVREVITHAGAIHLEGDFAARLASLRTDLVRFANWLCRDPVTGEDLVQETLFRAWRARHALRDAALVRPWLLTICRREYARLWERQRRKLISLESLELREVPVVESCCDDQIVLSAALSKLDPAYRDPLILQVIVGCSVREIAAELGLTRTATLTRLFRARSQLRLAAGLDMARKREPTVRPCSQPNPT